MTIEEFVNSPEDLEPETLRYFLPDISSEDFEWVMAARTVKQTTHFVEDMYVFENIVRALNKLPVSFAHLQGVAPKHIFYAMDLISRLWKDVKINYSWEVQKYIQYMFNEDGVHSIYPYDDIEQKYYDVAQALLDPDNEYTIKPTNPVDVMGQRLAEMLMYTTLAKKTENK